MAEGQIQDIVKLKVENLRPKLLDLSRRNPLIATKLSPRSNAHIRVVDELPDVLFYKLNNGQEMRLAALPEIDDDPKDEDSKIFRDALSNARITDESYLADLEAIDRDAEDYLDRARHIERALKDRVRVDLQMPERPKKAEVNLVQHAKNNGITPSYDLPNGTEAQEEERHLDNDIQTLLLPKDLERKLNNVTSKCRTWIQETGINVLHVAYGFLEWSEPNQTETSFAPLILAATQIEKRRSRNGVEFWIAGTGDEPETNAVLAEKLKLEFGVELPPLEGSSVEDYFEQIEQIAPKHITWRIRRQIAIGVFPSARMAMYHDLDPEHPALSESEIIGNLLGGMNTETSAPFADEYNVDEPEIEKSVPCIVMDADSSQFSALVDIAHGKNLAVEGPPGTGKSQTIVNTIAAALASGKKVLFVAEKLAALNVVKSRLEAIGLGEFLLPLQAERSTREQVIKSVRNRVEMRSPLAVRDYDAQVAEFQRVRAELASYIEVLSAPFGESGLTIHEILGKSISTASSLTDVSAEVLAECAVPEPYLNAAGLKRLRDLAQTAERAHAAASEASEVWKSTGLIHPERFTVEDACNLALRGSNAFRELVEARAGLPGTGLSDTLDVPTLQLAKEILRAHALLPASAQEISAALLESNTAEHLAGFLASCDVCAAETQDITRVVAAEIDERLLEQLGAIEAICADAAIETLDLGKVEAKLHDRRETLTASRALAETMKPLVGHKPEAASWRFTELDRAHQVIGEATRAILLCRSPVMADPSAVSVLKTLCAEGRDLQEQKARLSQKAVLTSDVSPEALSACAATLRSSGIFSLFSGEYRRAVRQARSLMLAAKFEKPAALALLEELADFRIREREFLRNPQAAALFGIHFRGVDTDFDVFDRLAAFYDKVNTEFGGPDYRQLRDFLRVADIDELELIPAISDGAPVETFESLQGDLADAEQEIQTITQAIAALRPILALFHEPAAVSPAELSGLSRRVRELLENRRNLEGESSIAALLGNSFRGWRTETAALHEACAWAASALPHAREISAALAACNAPDACVQIERVIEIDARADAILYELCDLVRIAPEHFKGSGDYSQTAEKLAQASRDPDGLFSHAAFATALDGIKQTGTVALVSARLQAANDLRGIADQIEALAVRTLAKHVYAAHGSILSKYSGAKLDELRAALARKDREIIDLSRRQLRCRIHAGARPPYGNGMGKKSTWTQMALIDNEISKQQRFVAVRDLTERAGKALLELKPCWMMSPLAVAQYIKKGALQFDLCIIDEASQMPPEAAVGALLRCNQTMVVGDTNQLPPSSFFKKMIDDEDADEDETVLNESILEMANATFRPPRRLRWHYRSKHSGLIKFSNRLVYQDDLIVFPSATESMSHMGVEFQAIEGLYKAGTNAIEARAIVDAALEFMRTDPNRSLGIVTLNQKQRELISEEFDYALGGNRQALDYVEAWKERNDGLEEFFIKNLENVQGDERDVIFIGTVYGPETKGAKPMQRFGPINGLAGKRRLNVLFSRAKEKIVTFSSMTAADIVAEEGGNAGVYMLKRWLEYSASGVLEGGVTTHKEPDSDFEVFVINQIQAMGYEPVPQVGVAGYFVDIGVRHPDWPHGYVLGVECDGASYHSAKSARDRDRLRQEVLERLGWRFHRIWSTDWFNNPQREAERLREVIIARMEELKGREAEFKSRPISDESAEIRVPEPIAERSAPLFDEISSPVTATPSAVKALRGIGVGDTVRVRYLTDDRKVLEITISKAKSDPGSGLIHFGTPIAQALLGAEEGDEVEVLVGSYVRPAVVERIVKNAG